MSDFQPFLFGAPVQPRRRRKEETRIYDAVTLLRARGRKIYRAGPEHFMVDGERLNRDMVMALAATILKAG